MRISLCRLISNISYDSVISIYKGCLKSKVHMYLNQLELKYCESCKQSNREYAIFVTARITLILSTCICDGTSKMTIAIKQWTNRSMRCKVSACQG